MPTREIIRIDTEHEEEDLTLPVDCLVRPSDGRKPFIVRERYVMVPTFDETSVKINLLPRTISTDVMGRLPTTLMPYRGDRTPQPQNITFERRNNILYAVLTQDLENPIIPPVLKPGQEPFITTVRFKEELRSLHQPSPHTVVPSTLAPAPATVTVPPVPNAAQASILSAQGSSGSAYFSFSQSGLAPAVPLAIPLAPPAPAALVPPPPVPAAAQILPPAAVGAMPPAPHPSSSSHPRRSSLFGTFDRFFGPQIPPADYWQGYQDSPFVGTKRKGSDDSWCCGSPSKRIRNTLVVGVATLVVISALSKDDLMEVNVPAAWQSSETLAPLNKLWSRFY